MALSNPASSAVPLESEARVSLRPASPVASGFSTYGNMPPKVWTATHSQQHCHALPRQSVNFEAPQLQRAPVIEGGKEATTQDFLSLYGAKRAGLCENTTTRGLASSVTTQNLLQPLEKGNLLSSRGLDTSANVGSEDTSYGRIKGTLDLPSNVLYRADRGDFVTGGIQGDTTQKLEGKADDLKESTSRSTPRSKHSAMEQRRRTKINDRFQMLRQLVPNVDQKRDKASFLLEVIEYVKALQEKARKYEAAEQHRQQERLKPLPWDVCQRNPGSRDSNANSSHIPSVNIVSLDTRKASDSNGSSSSLPATRENEGSAELMSNLSQAAGGLQALHSISDNRNILGRSISDLTSEERLQRSKQGKLNEESESLKSSLDQDPKEMGLFLTEFEKQGSKSALDVSGPEEEQKSKGNANEQAHRKEPLTVHGGVINVSSLYSQGLLDTLTRALQSSGLDLTKATISVQIDLGRPGIGAGATGSRKANSQTTTIHKGPASSPELQHPAKKSKVEVDA